MKEHPIPQDVTGYRFHIVGNMTLKQFAEVGAGVLVAVIIYNTNLITFVKWPLIILSVGLGGLMAFVPIEERPLDHWITTFFRRLYSPTKFYWKREKRVPFALKPRKEEKKPEQEQLEVDLTPARRKRITEYLASIEQSAPTEEWEAAENNRVSQIIDTFGEVTVDEVDSKPQKIKPQLTPRVRVLAAEKPATTQTVFSSQATQAKQKSPTPTEPTQENQRPLPTPQAQQVEQQVEQESDQSSTKPLEKPPAQQVTTQQLPNEAVPTNNQLPFPKKEVAPNTILGMTLTADNKLIDRAVVTIKNTNNQPIQTLKTNVLGQFTGSAPLPNGTYVVTVEKEGFQFPEKTITLAGKAVEPLELRAA